MKRFEVSDDTVIGVVGDIHEHDEQFFEIVERFKPDKKRILVSVGDLYDKGFGIDRAEKIAEYFRKLNDQGIGHVVMGNHEFRHIRTARRNNTWNETLKWVAGWPYSLFFTYANRNRLVVCHAGVTTHHTWEDLANNTEIFFVRNLDENGKYIPLKWEFDENGKKILTQKRPGKPWHDLYDGRFGYIVTGHDSQSDGTIKFYPYSCNIDTKCYHTGILSCVVYNNMGRSDIIQVKGPAAHDSENPL